MNEYDTNDPARLPQPENREQQVKSTGMPCFRRTSTPRCGASRSPLRPARTGAGKSISSRMLALGVTKVEIGVQHVDDRSSPSTAGVAQLTIPSLQTAPPGRRPQGRVPCHAKPPGEQIEKDRELFRTLFDDPRFRPDFLKIYPTLVTPGLGDRSTLERGRVFTLQRGRDFIDLIAYGKSLLPVYVRLQRIQRDIPAKLIVAGSKHSNFRQLASDRLIANGGQCRCIRCREIGRHPSGETRDSSPKPTSAPGGLNTSSRPLPGTHLSALRASGSLAQCSGKSWREVHCSVSSTYTGASYR